MIFAAGVPDPLTEKPRVGMVKTILLQSDRRKSAARKAAATRALNKQQAGTPFGVVHEFRCR